MGKLHIGATAEGVLRGPGRGELDLGMIAECLLSQVQCRPSLDRMPPFKSRPTRLRWAASRVAEGEQPSLIRFTLAEDGLRTVELRLPEAVPPTAVATLCEDFALHDWLLTTVIHMLDRSLESGAAQAARVLRPVVDHLLHLWMPHAQVDPVLISLWDALERTPGFSRQWQNLAQRIRDQVAGWPREVNE